MLKWFRRNKKDKNKENREIEESKALKEKEEQLEDGKEAELKPVSFDRAEEKEVVVEKEEVIEKEAVVKEEEEIIEEVVEDKVVEEPKEEGKKKKPNFFNKLLQGLTKTRKEMTNKIDSILSVYKKIDDELFDDLEEALVTADVGVSTTMELIDRLKERVKAEKTSDPNEIKNLLKDEIKIMMRETIEDNKLNIEPTPAVILVVGVNGVGKTTTIGKLAYNFKKDGKKVLMAAGDTFRAAAIEQLEEWSNRAGVDIIAHKEGADPAAVIYDGIHAAKSRKADILICDTAGRLHNKSNLMNELNKIFRVVEREYPEATKEVLLVLDATTGQNAISQAKVFKEVANITGVALTKLDGTAKGGVVIALQSELGLPIKLVGVGEGIDDLQPFNMDDFVEALFE